MYEDTWYSYAAVQNPAKEETGSLPTKHRRKESLLKQPNVSSLQPVVPEGKRWHIEQSSNQISDAPEPILELFEDTSALKGPPKATLVKRAKSYSDFYDAAVSYLSKYAEKEPQFEFFEDLESSKIVPCFEKTFESYEGELLDASEQEYQYVDQSASVPYAPNWH